MIGNSLPISYCSLHPDLHIYPSLSFPLPYPFLSTYNYQFEDRSVWFWFFFSGDYLINQLKMMCLLGWLPSIPSDSLLSYPFFLPFHLPLILKGLTTRLQRHQNPGTEREKLPTTTFPSIFPLIATLNMIKLLSSNRPWKLATLLKPYANKLK